MSVSTNRSVNIKENKEKKNREKLLAGPGSEFSLANPEDMEMDYYDYNVINSAAAPGSYLGMDPAYLVYIPPLEDGTVDMDDRHYDESDDSDGSDTTNNESEPHYDEISPVCETPLQHSPPKNNGTEDHSPEDNYVEESSQNRKFMVKNFKTTKGDSDCQKNRTTTSLITGNVLKKSTEPDSILMTEFKNSNKILRYPGTSTKINQEQRCSYASDDKDMDTEKETAVVKSPSGNFKEYYELDDIQFADEDDEEIVEAFNSNRNDFTVIKNRELDKSKTIFEMH